MLDKRRLKRVGVTHPTLKFATSAPSSTIRKRTRGQPASYQMPDAHPAETNTLAPSILLSNTLSC